MASDAIAGFSDLAKPSATHQPHAVGLLLLPHGTDLEEAVHNATLVDCLEGCLGIEDLNSGQKGLIKSELLVCVLELLHVLSIFLTKPGKLLVVLHNCGLGSFNLGLL